MSHCSFPRFIRRQFGVELPYLFEGTWEEAQETARRETKYLIVCLHSQFHEYGQEFFSKVLLHDELMAQFMERSVFYGACVEDAEGVKLLELYPAKRFPTLLVLFKNEVAMEIGGAVSSDSILKEWRRCTDVWDAIVAEEVSFKADQSQRRMELEMEEQRLAALEVEDKKRLDEFEAQQKEKERLERQRGLEMEQRRQAQESAAREAERMVMEEQERTARAAREKQQSQFLLTEEPAAETDNSASTSSGSGVLAIRFRFPKGQQLTRRFRRSDLVDQMLYYVRSVDFDDGASAVQLVMGYPPKPLEWEAGVTTFADVKQLSSNMVINVRLVK